MKIFVIFFSCLLLVVACGGKTTQQKQADRNLALLEESAADADFAKGRTLVLEERFAEAIPYLEKSGDADALFLRALALSRMGRQDEAAALFAVCVQNGTQVAESLYNIGLIAYETGDMVSAIARMEEVLTREPGHAGAHYFIASAAYQKLDMTAAETHFRAAAKNAPGNGAAWEGLFYALVTQNKFAEAWELRENIDLATGDNLLNVLLVGEKAGKGAEALAIIDAVALIPESVVPAAAKLQRIILVAQIRGIAAAIAEAAALPKGLYEKSGFILLDRGGEGKDHWAVARDAAGAVLLTCVTEKGAEPAQFEVATAEETITIRGRSYPASKFRAAIPDLCKGK